MINKDLQFKDNIQPKKLRRNLIKKFSKKFDKIFLEVKNDIKNTSKTLNVLDKNFKFNFNPKDLKQFKKFKSIVFIGMGGSILGADAIYNFFQTKIKKNIYFLNDLNENKILNLKKKENFSKVLFIIISKSGNTIETLSNVLLLDILKKNSKNIIIISEKKKNFLYLLSKRLNLFHIEHKSNIGGRYSVLSEVGIVPAYLMGLNILKLRSRLLICLGEKNKSFLKSNTIKLAHLMNSNKFNNLVFLNYFPELDKFLYWGQQLIAESLGKKNMGFLPIVSKAPKDHHSLLQLYLDGPKDKIFNIFIIERKFGEKININRYLDIKNFLNRKKLITVKKAQKQSVIRAFIKKKIPFREFRIKAAREEVLGKLFSYFIIETIILGKLLNINPFDQPAVEQVKVYTKQILS